MEVQFKEERADSARCCGFAREGENDVAVLVQEVENILRAQRRTETCYPSIELQLYVP